MNILVINAGSSSLKFQVLDSTGGAPRLEGRYRDIGETVVGAKCVRTVAGGGTEDSSAPPVADHPAAVADLLGLLRDAGAIDAVGHRVVHGGERYGEAELITPRVLEDLEKISALAPLHNPVALECVRAVSASLPGVPNYAVFDTAFHRTIPEAAYLYGLPLRLYREMGIRKYGFHGTNHKYAAFRAAELLGRAAADLKIITCHLGNGQSVCAVKAGRSVDTSMGFTPLEGLPMGTRSGSFDPEIVFFLMERGMEPGEIRTMINRQSGLLGLSGISSDYRVIEEKARRGDPDARRASDLLVNRVTCVIGAYAAEMNGADAIVFTGGIGENSSYLRKQVLENFGYLGLELDEGLNERHGPVITGPGSAVRALVVRANEELQIAREVAAAMGRPLSGDNPV